MFGFKKSMKISSITSTFLPQRIYSKTSNPVKPKVNEQGDIFVSFKSSLEENLLIKPKFGISDYKALTPLEKRMFINTCNSKDRKRAETNIELALEIKENLDGLYGEDNYVFECIGTSPAPIARVLEFMGVETHYFPISNLITYNFDKAKEEIEQDPIGREKYAEFLASQGVKPDMLENDKRTFLFYDFTSTGRSLGLVRDLLEECYDIPISYKIRYRSLNEDLHMLYDDEILPAEKKQCTILEEVPRQNPVSYKCRKVLSYIRKNLLQGEAEKYGGVPHLSLNELRNIDFAETSSILRPNEHKYNFCVIDKLNQMGLLKENPANEVSL